MKFLDPFLVGLPMLTVIFFHWFRLLSALDYGPMRAQTDLAHPCVPSVYLRDYNSRCPTFKERKGTGRGKIYLLFWGLGVGGICPELGHQENADVG